MGKYAMLIDTIKCTACRGCQVACKQWWDLQGTKTTNRGTYENPSDRSPNTWTRIKFTEVEVGGRLKWLFLKEGCLHCTNAPCVKVCPTSALKSNELGLVTLERDLCNGCGYCRMFCPFDIPRLEADVVSGYGKATKCNFCQDRVTNGQTPACVKTCPPGALSWGDRAEMLKIAQARVTALRADGHPNANLYGETELGGLGRLYVLTEKASLYGLPENPQYPALADLWQDLVQPFGYAAMALVAVGLGVSYVATLRREVTKSAAKEEPAAEEKKEG